MEKEGQRNKKKTWLETEKKDRACLTETTQNPPCRNDPGAFGIREVYIVAIVQSGIIPFHCLEPSAKSPPIAFSGKGLENKKIIVVLSRAV